MSEVLNIPRLQEFTWPVWGIKDEMILSVKDITGATAMWAVKQSPYNKPDNLEDAIAWLETYIIAELDVKPSGFIYITIRDLREFLNKAFDSITLIAAWNEPKIQTGALFQGSSSRYHTTKPDYDFIDLDALARNVSHTCGMEFFYWKG